MRRLLVGLLGATILVAGCGDDGERVSTPTIPGDTTSTTAAPTDTPVNEAGDPLTLDQAGDLACANAKFVQDSLLEGDTETGALDSADPLGAVQTFLTMCTDHGYEL